MWKIQVQFHPLLKKIQNYFAHPFQENDSVSRLEKCSQFLPWCKKETETQLLPFDAC